MIQDIIEYVPEWLKKLQSALDEQIDITSRVYQSLQLLLLCQQNTSSVDTRTSPETLFRRFSSKPCPDELFWLEQLCFQMHFSENPLTFIFTQARERFQLDELWKRDASGPTPQKIALPPVVQSFSSGDVVMLRGVACASISDNFNYVYAVDEWSDDKEDELQISHIPKPKNKKGTESKEFVKRIVWLLFSECTLRDICKGKCWVCKRPISYYGYHRAHIIASKQNGSYTVKNIRPTCPLCNYLCKTQDLTKFKKVYKQLTQDTMQKKKDLLLKYVNDFKINVPA
jgi:hypothetical protein